MVRGGVLWFFGSELVRKERRRHARIDFSLPIEVVGHEGSDVIKNFSPGGLLVQTEAASEEPFDCSYGHSMFCSCPPRVYICKNLKK
jgi:hypothetical protein